MRTRSVQVPPKPTEDFHPSVSCGTYVSVNGGEGLLLRCRNPQHAHKYFNEFAEYAKKIHLKIDKGSSTERKY
jgi:hypothetical protein